MSQIKTRSPQAMLAACMLPWTEDFEFDVESFQRHVRHTLDLGYTHLYLMGTAGEGYALSDGQFREVAKIFAELTVRPNLRPQIGIISLSMRQIIERVEFGRGLGIRSFQISLPSWGVLSDAEMLNFFTGVCGRFPDCQFLHYNLPRAKRILSGKDYRRVADAVPNLVATKNSTSDYRRVADLMRNVPDIQHFFLEGGYAFGCLWGECSILNSFASLFPNSNKAFFEAGRKKDFATLWRLHKEFSELEPVLFGHLTEDHIDGAYDKVLTWLSDPKFPTRLLPPYNGLSDEEARGVREAFTASCGHLD